MTHGTNTQTKFNIERMLTDLYFMLKYFGAFPPLVSAHDSRWLAGDLAKAIHPYVSSCSSGVKFECTLHRVMSCFLLNRDFFESSVMTNNIRRQTVPFRRCCHYKLGFTLIELLVVISIIALLISILLPALSKARNAARNIQCMSQQRQLGLAMFSYLNDHNQVYPSYPDVSVPMTCWDWQISPYLSYSMPDFGDRSGWGPPIFHCPNGAVLNSNSAGASRGYAMNYWAASPIGVDAQTVGLNNGYGNTGRDSEQVLLAEAWRSSYSLADGQGGVGYPEVSVYGNRSNTQYLRRSSSDAVDVAYRHDDRANFLIKDGHVTIANPGISGYGENLFWFIRSDGVWFEDGFHSP